MLCDSKNHSDSDKVVQAKKGTSGWSVISKKATFLPITRKINHNTFSFGLLAKGRSYFRPKKVDQIFFKGTKYSLRPCIFECYFSILRNVKCGNCVNDVSLGSRGQGGALE